MVGWFVQQQHVGWVGEEYRQGQSALLSDAENPDGPVFISSCDESEGVQRYLFGPLHPDQVFVGLTGSPIWSALLRVGQVDFLREQSDTYTGRPVDGSRGRVEDTGEQVEQCGLTRAIGPGDQPLLAPANGQRGRREPVRGPDPSSWTR